MTYFFNEECARLFGVYESIFVEQVAYWVNYNKANGNNFHEGLYWTYNSFEAWEKLFPFWNKRIIKYIVKSCIEQDLIIRGNFNKKSFDKTMWYTLSKKGEKHFVSQKKVGQFCPMQGTILSHTRDNFVPPIPSNNQDNTTNNKEEIYKEEKSSGKFMPPSIEEVSNYLQEKGITSVDAETFCAFYGSKGWMIGKNKMKDWKLAIATWKKNSRSFNNGNQYNNARQSANANYKGDGGAGIF